MKSFVPERDRDLVLGLVVGRLSQAEFEHQFQGNPRLRALEWLEKSIEKQDALGVELSLHLGHRFGFPDATVSPLLCLATAGWHQRHEDVVDALAKLRVPESVGPLFEVATTDFPYREYDDSRSLAVKCIRALRRIENLDAVAKLATLSHSEDRIVAQAATTMLRRLVSESQSVQVRDAARAATS